MESGSGALDPRAALAAGRPMFGEYRTQLALDRTTLAWIRTALTFATFGFGMIGFFRALRQVNDNPANGIAFTRPLCVFPKLAQYKGVGNSNDAANWVCKEGLVNDATQDADAVLPDRGDGDRDDRLGDHD